MKLSFSFQKTGKLIVIFGYRNLNLSTGIRFSRSTRLDSSRRYATVEKQFPATLLHDLKLVMQFFTTKNIGEIELPKLSCETEGRPALVQVNQELDSQHAPEIGERNVCPDRFQNDVGVKRKRRPVRHEAGEGVAVEVIAMRRVGRPIWIRVMRSHNLNHAAGFGYPMKLRNKSHHIGHMLNNMAADHFVEFIIGKRIGKDPQVVNDIGSSARIGV